MTDRSTGVIAALLGIGAAIAAVVLCIIAWCKIFRKAGIHPGFYFIPGYGMFLQFKIADSLGLFIATCVLAGAAQLSSLFVTRTTYSFTNGYGRYYGSSDIGIASGVLVFLGLICAAAFVIDILYNIRLAKAYGKGGGFAAGLIFLPVIFLPILGFGSAEYVGTYVHGGKAPDRENT